MAEFIIQGGRKLSGEIEIAGSKNTALPSIAAALLTSNDVVLENVPAISDVTAMAEIIRALGGEAEYNQRDGSLAICGKNISSEKVPPELGKKLRASILFSGALLGRLGKAELPYPGGDNIGARPVKTHLNALRALGIKVAEEEILRLNAGEAKGSKIILEESSVTATENAILASVLLPGRTEIYLAACEPHVQELIKLLSVMGARARFSDVGVIEIEGVKKLHGARFRLNPDEIEISGFAALAAATKSRLLLKGAELKYLDAVLLQLSKMSVEHEILGNDILINLPKKDYEAFRIQSGLYPKLISDHLPPFAVLATQARGESMIHEWLYESRLKYIEELIKMGARAKVLDPHRALIYGPTPLHGTRAISYDVRAGLTVIIAALIAEGETRISGIEHVERGYERFEERLQKIGADIKRV